MKFIKLPTNSHLCSGYLPRAKQKGLTLLEVIVSLSIIAISTVGLNQIADRYSDDTKNTVAASQTRTFGEAANSYIKDNYALVQSTSTATAPTLVTVATLVAAGKLTSGYLATNVYGQTVCALVLQPSVNQLQAIVVGEGGTAVDDVSLGAISAVIGGSGGAVYAAATTVIRGAAGGWSLPVSTFDNLVNNAGTKCDGSAGRVSVASGHPVMALWFENGSTSSAYLARDLVPGQPQLNEMNTPLVMNSVSTANTACTRAGAIARDSSGAVLSCQSGTWKTQGSAFWQDAVATYAALPACTAAQTGQTRVVNTPTSGSGPRAYTCNGTTWSALAVNDAGNLTVSNSLTVGGAMSVSGLITAPKIALTDTVTVGTACATAGLISREANGMLASCQSGIWNRQSAAWIDVSIGPFYGNFFPLSYLPAWVTEAQLMWVCGSFAGSIYGFQGNRSAGGCVNPGYSTYMQGFVDARQTVTVTSPYGNYVYISGYR